MAPNLLVSKVPSCPAFDPVSPPSLLKALTLKVTLSRDASTQLPNVCKQAARKAARESIAMALKHSCRNRYKDASKYKMASHPFCTL